MEQAKAYIEYIFPGPNCWLLKALHGLNQAPSQWFERGYGLLRRVGFGSRAHDLCIYVKSVANVVDNMLVCPSFDQFHL